MARDGTTRNARVVVEAWAPEYGSAFDEHGAQEPSGPVDVNVEVPASDWTPLAPPTDVAAPRCLDFVDGVRRIDARVWITDEDGTVHMGICASYAAGLVRCDGRAKVRMAEVNRALFAPAGAPSLETGVGTYDARIVGGTDIEALYRALQQRMGELEIDVAEHHAKANPDPSALVMVDGPLSGRQHVPGAIGYVKTHHVAYLPGELTPVIAALAPGQRSPLFVTQTSWSRFSWYLRLPGAQGHPWAGVVRCEASADRPLEDVRHLADQTALTLPRFASTAHKDPRAPQNLYPIAALERELRRRLGDSGYVWRALKVAAG